MASLGEYLRQERESRGLTVEQVASSTKISVRFVHALEEDQYQDLPAKPFVRGFVTAYSRYLNLPSNQVLEDFREFIDEQTRRSERIKLLDDESNPEIEEERSRKRLMWMLVGAIGIGAFMIVVLKPALNRRHISHVEQLKSAHGHVKTAESSENQNVSSEAAAAVVQGEETNLSKEDVAKSEGATSSATGEDTSKTSEESKVSEVADTEVDKDPLHKGDDLKPEEVRERLMLRTLERTWVRYQVDERSQMQFLLLKGRYLVLKAKARIYLEVSNPQAVEFRYRSAGYRRLAEYQGKAEESDRMVFVFPEELSESAGVPFETDKELPETPGPEAGAEFQKFDAQ